MKRFSKLLLAAALLGVALPASSAHAWPCWHWFGGYQYESVVPAQPQAQPQPAAEQQANRQRQGYRSYSLEPLSDGYMSSSGQRGGSPYYMHADHKVRGF